MQNRTKWQRRQRLVMFAGISCVIPSAIQQNYAAALRYVFESTSCAGKYLFLIKSGNKPVKIRWKTMFEKIILKLLIKFWWNQQSRQCFTYTPCLPVQKNSYFLFLAHEKSYTFPSSIFSISTSQFDFHNNISCIVCSLDSI